VKNPIKVVVRVRPTPDFAANGLLLHPDKKTVNIKLPKNAKYGDVVNSQPSDYNFKFDSVLNNASQETMYEVAAEEITSSVLDGYNGTIMAYGQTGAGKTFTISGGTANYKERGITPRCISHIFREIAARPEHAFVVRCSYLEIYNERMYDLLATAEGAPVGAGTQDLAVSELNGSVHVKGLTHLIASSEEEALSYLFEGETNRAIASHQLNRNSTRSHCIFTMHLESRSRVESSERVTRGKLNLVDLAGSERIKKSGSDGVLMQEAMYINKSLTFLEQVVIALADRSRDHIPYRQAVLTNVLKDSLGGNSKTLMCANIWGQAEHLDETLSTLKFASRMMRIANEVVVNTTQDPSLLLKKYEREIRDLRQELAMHDTLANRSRVQYEDYTEEQRHQLHVQMKKWVNNEIEELEVVNLRQVKEYFRTFKNYIRNIESEVKEKLKAEYNMVARGDGDVAMATNGDSAPAEGGVGDIDRGDGFSVGVAPSSAVPKETVGAHIASMHSSSEPLALPEEDDGATLPPPIAAAPSSRAAAFAEYKAAEGQESYDQIEENKSALKLKKRLAKELSVQVNVAKREIDSLKAAIDEKKQRRDAQPLTDGEDEVIDEEEFAFFKRMKEQKNVYRTRFVELKQAKDEAKYLTQLVDNGRRRLISGFEAWYKERYGGAESEPDLGPAVDETGEVLDYGEQFDKMEMEKITSEDPDSVSFYNATKSVASRKNRPAMSQKGKNKY